MTEKEKLTNDKNRPLWEENMRSQTNEKSSSMISKSMYENIKNEITLSAILNCVYIDKISSETIQTKVTNQMNSMEVSINRINPKYNEKSKNYDKIKQQILDTLQTYEENLVQFCQFCDKEIQEIIFKKVELESKLLMAVITKEYLYQKDKKEQKPKSKNIIVHSIGSVVEKIKTSSKEKKQIDVSMINRIQDGKQVEKEIKEKIEFSEEYKNNQSYIRKLEQEIKRLNQKINDLNKEKVNKTFSAMEAGDKQLSTQIRRPHTIKRITSFFANRFNTYQVIIKSVIEPIYCRIEEFKTSELKKVDIHNKEFNLQEIEQKIEKKQNLVLNHIDNKIICKEMGIL